MRLLVTVVSPVTRQSSDILLDADPATPIAAVAAALDRFARGACAPQQRARPSSAVSLYVDYQRIWQRLTLAEAPIRDGCVISLGRPDGCVMPGPAGPGLAPGLPSDAVLRPSPDGAGIDFSRPPRQSPALPTSSRPSAGFTRPAAPPAADRRSLPLLMAGLPLIIGMAMAFLLHQVYLLGIAAASPVLLIGGALRERGGGRGRTAAQLAGSAERTARIERDAQAALDAELAGRREQCPDPATLLGIASGPRGRLWERRRTDPDYLLLRVGTADLPVTVELAGPDQVSRRTRVVRSVPDAPVAIPLAECGVLGVAGPADHARAVGRWLVAQAAVLHGPSDLRIYLLTDASGQASWEWVRWLPHCRPGPGGSCAAQLGNDAESVAARIAELLAIIDARRVIRDAHRGAGPGAGIVVVLDGSRKLRSLPGVSQLLGEGPPVGVYAICLDHNERLLPAQCQAVAVLGRDGLLLQQTMADTVGGVRADHADPGWCARVARSLAPIRDVSGDGGQPPFPAADGHRPAPAAPPTPAAPASRPAEVWLAPVGWAALGRPEPGPPAGRQRAEAARRPRGDALANGRITF
jgi:S-DNA-T family DNA segregation ATPase FtsK/SpoIIIE